MSIPQSEREKVHETLKKLSPREKARLLSEAASEGLEKLPPEDRAEVEKAAKELIHLVGGGLGTSGALQTLAALGRFIPENLE